MAAVLGRYGPSAPASGALTLRLADDEGRRLKGSNEQPTSYLSTGGFQLTDQISSWDPEREHTAQIGKCKLLDVR